jgi:TetR/AcrR family transcriptional repressor of nem operon
MDMGKPQPDKRTRLIETAMKLAYRNGFRETSLADIAEAAHVPIGNVYYYFKTKEELGAAVVERRLAQFREFREEMDRLSSPRERLFAFVESIHRNREQLAHGGCPLGDLCSELQKQGGALAKKSAALFTEPMGWLEKQFRAAGHEEDARELSVHLFCAFQGLAAVAHAANDPDLVVMEVKRLKDWIGTVRLNDRAAGPRGREEAAR